MVAGERRPTTRSPDCKPVFGKDAIAKETTDPTKDPPMRFFANDLYRNFAIGFVIAAIGVGVANAERVSGEISPPAYAAEPHATLQPAPEFVIAPLPGEAD